MAGGKPCNKKIAVAILLLMIFCLLFMAFDSYAEQDVVQTEEKTEEGVLHVGYLQDRIPLSYTDGETGEFQGIVRGILDMVEAQSGLEFEYVALPLANIDVQYLEEHQIDILANAAYDPNGESGTELYATSPYLTSDKVIVCQKDLEFDIHAPLRLATGTGLKLYDKVLSERYPDFSHVTYSNIKECFEAVLKGEADVIMINKYVADYWLARPRYESLNVLPAEVVSENHSLVVPCYEIEDMQACMQLCEKLNAAIKQLDEQEINMLVIHEVSRHRYQYTWKDFVYQYKVTVFIIIVLLLVTFGTLLLMLQFKRHSYQELEEKERRLYVQQKRYELLLEKAEETIFEIDLRTGETVASEVMKDKFGWTFGEHIYLEEDSILKIWQIYKDDAPILLQSFEKVRAGQPSECEVRLKHKEQGYIWCRINRYPITNKKGEVVKIVGKIMDIDQMTREANRLREETRIDKMTGILHKNAFLEELSKELVKPNVKNFCLIFMDIDHFKLLNDTLGHIMGDKAIVDTACRLKDIFGEDACIGRFGGDEFCVLLTNIIKEEAEEKLNCLRDSLRSVYSDRKTQVFLTSSIGAVYSENKEQSVQLLLESADRALYESKRNGRDKVTLVLQ